MNVQRMPALFVGHGNPMNAIEASRYTAAWQTLGSTLPTPTAIVAISAHWWTPDVAVTAMAQPRTIHDFGGFPQALYRVAYPAPGSQALASRVAQLLAPHLVSGNVRMDQEWGLDHGTWSVLVRMYPEAKVPVIQLSLAAPLSPSDHFELARALAPLRDEGVLIVGSGNVVHNLRAIRFMDHAPAYDWAARFEQQVCDVIVNRDHQMLVNYLAAGEDARLSVPTPDHYLPLLYVLAQRGENEPVSFPVRGIDLGSISMLSVVVGS